MSAPVNVKLRSPVEDIAALTDQFGQAWGMYNETIIQFLAWAELAGIFTVLDRMGSATLPEIQRKTCLNTKGMDSLCCILLSLKVLIRDGARYRLSALAQDYLVRHSPYFAGHGLYLGCNKPLPRSYTGKDHEKEEPGEVFPELQLNMQHSRNFAPSVAAVRTGQFAQVRHLVDIAGGSGTFAIPLALDYPGIRITLVDLPRSIDAIGTFLKRYGVEDRVQLIGMDICRDDWAQLPHCDGVLFSNILHTMDDRACAVFCRKGYDLLVPGGRMWLHEVLFNENRTGPMIAALWNATMRMGDGRQRTASELSAIAASSGFVDDCAVTPTGGRFSLLRFSKPDQPSAPMDQGKSIPG